MKDENAASWFTVDPIDQDTYAISEYKHWEETHCYLLCGSDCAVLIDTGLGVSNIKNIVDSLTALPIRVVTTHVHWDHIGGHGYFDHIGVFEKEQAWLSEKFPLSLQAVKQNIMHQPCDFPRDFNIENYRIFQGLPTEVLYDGDMIHLGNRQIKVIHTPGHSPGHCCFYEQERKYLFSGDLIYKGCLDAFYPTTDPLLFFESIQKVKALAIDRILPGHHQLDIPTDLLNKIEAGFHQLSHRGQLKQGGGIFEFSDFQIHL